MILKFSIDKNGNFIYHNPFEGMILVHIEIGRISKLLPKFSPGIKNGHKIRVNYSLPFFITKRK